MAGNTQPQDITSSGSPLNPPAFKTFSADPYGAQATNTSTSPQFFTQNRYTTGTSSSSDPGGSVRSFDFISQQILGSSSS